MSAIDPKKGEFFEYGKTIVSMVDIDTTVYRRKLDNTSIRRNITLPKWLDMARLLNTSTPFLLAEVTTCAEEWRKTTRYNPKA